jgi:hypothetical protein
MLFRAKDIHFIEILYDYRDEVMVTPEDLLDQRILEAIKGHVLLAEKWRQDNAHLIKYPDLPEEL